MTTFTCYLFARPRFRNGMGRILDAGGTFDCYNYSPSAAVADATALYSDWKTVGKDIEAGLVKAADWEDEKQPWLINPSEIK